MSTIYNGPSKDFDRMVDGYVDYAMSVISARAVPDIRDGLKPVNRRILYSAYENDNKRLKKSSSIVSDAMKLHPHGDGAIYSAFVLMTDENGTYNVPFFQALGNLGKCYSSSKEAAMRYTKAMLNDNMLDFFSDTESMELVSSEEGEGKEPKVLPARYPVVLVNGAEGIAVSAGTKMPSFNFADVADLVVKYITNGDLNIEDAIAPDFPTGGILVRDDTELAKIMLTGKGKLKIRAKVEIEGKTILVKEVPAGKTVEGIVKAIKDAEIQGISSCIDTIGRNSRALVTINCKSLRVVEEVLLTLYRMNILQSVFASNILVIDDSTPKILGVYGIIKEWVKWRKSILNTKFNYLLEGIESEKKTLSYFIKLVNNEEWKDEYVRRLTKTSKKDCQEYLEEIFSDIPKEVCDWIYDRKGNAFNRGGTYANRYEALLNTETLYNGYLADLDSYIVNEMGELKREKASKGYCNRRTEVTYKDYKFSRISNTSEIEDTSYCVYTLKKDGFLVKSRTVRFEDNAEDIICTVEGDASSVLIGFDNFGRVLRVIGKEIPFTKEGEPGTYLSKYFDATFEPEYKVLYLCRIDGKRRMLVYRDGYIGFFDTSEFVGKKNTKIISNGVPLAVRDQLLEIYEEDEIPQHILLADDTGNYLKMGVVCTENVPVRSRTSRAKVLTGSDTINTKYLKGFNGFELTKYIENPDAYIGKLKRFKGKFFGDPGEMLDGKYLELCKDLA